MARSSERPLFLPIYSRDPAEGRYGEWQAFERRSHISLPHGAPPHPPCRKFTGRSASSFAITSVTRIVFCVPE
jgi:hypothetical protein